MKQRNKAYRLVFTALMAAMVYVGTMIKIPLGESNLSIANTICLLCGLMLAPVNAGLAAGLGSAINDLTFGGYGALDAGITFVSKFLMAFVCAAAKRIYDRRKAEKPEGSDSSFALVYAAGCLLGLCLVLCLRKVLLTESVKGYLLAVILMACAVFAALSEKKKITVVYAAAMIGIVLLKKKLDTFSMDLYTLCLILLGYLLVKSISILRCGKKETEPDELRPLRFVCAMGAISYVILYMLKTFVLGLTLYNLTLTATYVRMGAKLPASVINGVVAVALAPGLYAALIKPLTEAGIAAKLNLR